VGSDVSGPGIAIKTAPGEPRGFVTTFNDTVVPIDTTTLSVTRPSEIPVGSTPFGIALTPNGARAYVVNNCQFCEENGSVSVIDITKVGATPSPVPSTPIPVGFLPTGIAIGQNTNGNVFAYVTNSGDNTVSVIDTAQVPGGTHQPFAELTVGANPFAVALTPDGNFAYVANSGDGTVSVIDTKTNTIMPGPITVRFNPQGIAVGVIGTPVATRTPTRTPTITPTTTVVLQ
jgi:YVTN family beta-propeller protein